MLRFSFYLTFVFLILVSIAYSQSPGLHCSIKINNGGTSYETCAFYADQDYLCEIEAYEYTADCTFGGAEWYACSLYVWKNGGQVAGTTGWLGQYGGDWLFWSTYFPVNEGDYIEITVVYTLMT